MKKILNLSLVFAILSVIGFVSVIIFQNNLTNAEYYGDDFIIPKTLLIIEIISFVTYIISYTLIRKGMKDTKRIYLEVLGIILILVVGYLINIFGTVYTNLSYMKDSYDGIYKLINIINYVEGTHKLIGSNLYAIILVLAAGISIGKKKIK